MAKFPTSLKFCIFADVLIFFYVIVYSFKMIHKTFERNETTLEYAYGHVKEFVRPKKKHYWAWTKTLFDDYLLCTDYFDQKPEQLRTLT